MDLFAGSWDVVWLTVVAQFSDLPDAGQATRDLTRLLLAALLGGLIGYEREHKGKSAGLRTHILVALGSALLVLMAKQAGMESDDLSRVIQGIVSGIGFIGAGTIFMRSAESGPRGLTTAAGIWLTAAVGVTAGMGHGATAVLVTLVALAVLALLPLVTPRPPKPPIRVTPPDQTVR